MHHENFQIKFIRRFYFYKEIEVKFQNELLNILLIGIPMLLGEVH